jgi:hypothetical protein
MYETTKQKMLNPPSPPLLASLSLRLSSSALNTITSPFILSSSPSSCKSLINRKLTLAPAGPFDAGAPFMSKAELKETSKWNDPRFSLVRNLTRGTRVLVMQVRVERSARL